MLESVLFFYLALCIIVGVAASKRCGRSGIGWTLLSWLISPLLAGLLLLAVGRRQPTARSVTGGNGMDYAPFWRGRELNGFWTALIRHPTAYESFWEGDSFVRALLLAWIPGAALATVAGWIWY
jgi:hypothetical protein